MPSNTPRHRTETPKPFSRRARPANKPLPARRGDSAAGLKRSANGSQPTSHRGSHSAPRRGLSAAAIVSRPRLTALISGSVVVAGLVAAFTVTSAADPSDNAVLEGTALGSSSDSVSRGSSRLPLLESGVEAAQSGAATSKAIQKDRRVAIAAAKKAAQDKRRASTRQARIQSAVRDPRSAARNMLGNYGWGADQMTCLDALWQGESNWDHRAINPSSGAYGIPQSLPATKMASEGADWQTNPLTQIRWGLGYIKQVYGDPCSANQFKIGNNWY